MDANRRVVSAALVTAVAIALSPAGANAQPEPARPGKIEVVTGTICRIDTQARTVDLLTGVGHAILVQRVLLAPDVAVKGRGVREGITALVPGTVCRLECQVSAAGASATSVEVIQPAPGRKP